MDRWLAAVVQLAIETGSPHRNEERALALLDGMEIRPSLALLPELFSTGYALERASEMAGRAPQTLATLARWARSRRVCLAGTLLHPWEGGVANAAFLVEADGRLHDLYPKVHLFRPMEEERYLTAGGAAVVWRSSLGALAVATCYDLRFPVFCRRLAGSGARALLVPAEWPRPRTPHWELLLRARAVESQWFVLGANRVGAEGKTVFEGASQIVDPWGEVLARMEAEEGVATAWVEPGRADEARWSIPVFQDQVPGLDD